VHYRAGVLQQVAVQLPEEVLLVQAELRAERALARQEALQ